MLLQAKSLQFNDLMKPNLLFSLSLCSHADGGPSPFFFLHQAKPKKLQLARMHTCSFFSSELGQQDSKDNKFPSKSFFRCHWQQSREETTKCHVNLINLVLYLVLT